MEHIFIRKQTFKKGRFLTCLMCERVRARERICVNANLEQFLNERARKAIT